MNFCGQELMREGGKMFWTETFLNYLRNYAVDKIFKFQYLAEDRWRDAEIINKKAVDKNILLTVIISSEESFAIKGVRIVDSDETVLGQLSENIKKNSSVLTFEWTFPLYEI